jgi:hypothetical protein
MAAMIASISPLRVPVSGVFSGAARSRGEIAADCDLELVPDIVIGLNVLQIMLGETPDREHASRVLNTIIYPLVTQRKR